MKKIVGLMGKQRSGKTSVANEMYTYQYFTILSFATPLKEALVKLTGLDMEYFTDGDLKDKPIPGLGCTPRYLMQKMATEFVRDMISPDFFIWRMRQEIEKTFSNIIIDDIRFINEAELVREYGGFVIKIHRPSITSKDTHKSEKLNFEPDKCISNDGNIAQLYNIVNSLLIEYYGK